MTLIELPKSEFKLFFNWLRSPVNMVVTIKYLFQLFRERANPKNPLGATKTYTYVPTEDATFRYCSCLHSCSRSEIVDQDIVLSLAGAEYALYDSVDWNKIFADKEDYSALHRFCWLNNNLHFFMSCETGYQLIINWIESYHHNEDDLSDQSYNISERLVSWMIFLTRWKDDCFLDEEFKLLIFNSIKKQLYLLANNLEQHGEHYSNNHLLNNGRALYMIGWFVNDTSMVDLGRQCIRFGYKKLISEKGFLKEHSSHYHLLIFKNFVEIFLLATEFDSNFQKELQPTVERMFAVSSLFIGPTAHSSIPLIGDISPDISPLYLSKFCFLLNRQAEAQEEKKSDIDWFDTWDVSKVDLSVINSHQMLGTIFKDSESGFFYCRRGVFRFYFHNPVSMSKPNFSHYHSDDLSFTLMIGDKPIIQDPGRSSYIQSHQLSQYSKSSYSHNTVFLNQTPISPVQFKFFPPCYSQPKVVVKENERKDIIDIQVLHDGFRRIQKNIYFQRKFEVSQTSFHIYDSWKLPHQGNVVTRFHLGDEITKVCQRESYLILILEKSNEEIKLSYKVDQLTEIKICRGVLAGDAEKCGGWFFPRYGVSVPAYTLDFIQELSGEFVNQFEIKGTIL